MTEKQAKINKNIYNNIYFKKNKKHLNRNIASDTNMDILN